MFRTQTGQTGTDAYEYEAAAIANELRELRARMDRLTTAIKEENDELLCPWEFVPGKPDFFDMTKAARLFTIMDVERLLGFLRAQRTKVPFKD